VTLLPEKAHRDPIFDVSEVLLTLELGFFYARIGAKKGSQMPETQRKQPEQSGMPKMERYLTIKQMHELSGFSESFFITNASLARHGKKAATLPPLQKIGRNVRCKESEFYRWMDGSVQEVAA
jgi:predicted DNA-binding transcriptional regulator AlpA